MTQTCFDILRRKQFIRNVRYCDKQKLHTVLLYARSGAHPENFKGGVSIFQKQPEPISVISF